MTFLLKKTKDDNFAKTKLDHNWLSLCYLFSIFYQPDWQIQIVYEFAYFQIRYPNTSKLIDRTADWLWILAGLWSLILSLLFPLIFFHFITIIALYSNVWCKWLFWEGEWCDICVWWIVFDCDGSMCVWKDSTRCVCVIDTEYAGTTFCWAAISNG